jgi:excinuclease ABC subunit C
MQNQALAVTVPKAGDKKKLVDLSQKNVDYFNSKAPIAKQEASSTGSEKCRPCLKCCFNFKRKYLQLAAYPFTIECFDNSQPPWLLIPCRAMGCFK